jgi:hypothetical protein
MALGSDITCFASIHFSGNNTSNRSKQHLTTPLAVLDDQQWTVYHGGGPVTQGRTVGQELAQAVAD